MNPPSQLPVRLFSTDLDGTILGNAESVARFKSAWESITPDERPMLVYNSGRLVDDMRGLITAGVLPEPEYLIGGVGTQIFNFRTGESIQAFTDTLSEGWDLAKVQHFMETFPGATRQPIHFTHAFKSSWYLEGASTEVIDELRRHLADLGLKVNVVYSSSRDLDILPCAATKGEALKWLARELRIPLKHIVVAGDTGNDSTMFQVKGVRGIIVENAKPELFEAVVGLSHFQSRKIMADGVLDGLCHFGVVCILPTAEQSEISHAEMDPEFKMLFTGTRLGSLDDEERALICEGYEKAIVALRKNITPLGFSACSLEDNTITGTDANYRSVWARDGGITVISTLELTDPDIREAQRNTLTTLLNAASPTGQIPANVRIDDGVADYSGVGNICSIDSGLWVIIAVYNYVQKTKDYAFLREFAPRLQSAMNWLSAHDSNNDGLLEIPEAGDWTDLFGRSYNVLYDEVLWYRANICFGRLLEFLGEYERAGDYLRWSQHIQSRVISMFWPSTNTTQVRPSGLHHFADRQYNMGDTQYLLAEITPFAFNWRCDVFGNVLAYLTNLLDVDRARSAFQFMWGVGVNDPWPVANLYPVVQAGDPDWKPYYTVNLLNLPNHYHNGGIWPFVGAMWVRFIHRLGFHEVACRELAQLARLNKMGRDHEWEFNEWAHGKTGRPMGKAYQAWSAAAFIRACQEVEAAPEHLGHD